MSNVIQFLESMGGNAVMARMTAADYESAIAMLDADRESREALGLRDHSRLSELLNGRPKMMCVIVAPDEKENEQPENAPDETEDDSADRKSAE